MQIQIGKISDGNLPRSDIRQMHALRHQVFRERLRWDVACNTDDEGTPNEQDDFDALDPTYMLVKGVGDEVVGCWRMLPTTGPYMLKDTFPETLCGHAAPERPEVWELSRFALSSHKVNAFRFSQAAVAMMESAVEFAMSHGVTQFVTVTTVAIERMMKTLSIPVRRFGIPVQVGIEKTVAFSIDVNLSTLVLLRRHTGSVLADEKIVA